MKKAIALLVALSAALTLGAVTFAASDSALSVAWSSSSTDAAPLVDVVEDQLVLGYSTSTTRVIVTPELFLTPGKEYSYNIYKVDSDQNGVAPNAVAMTAINDTMLSGGKIRLRTVKGSGQVTSSSISKKGSGANALYTFKIEPKETYGVKENEVEYNVVVTGQSSTTVSDGNFLFKTGYRSMTDDDIDSYGEGDIVTVPDDRPVITKDQFATLAENNSYKPVSFSGEEGDWIFKGRVSGMDSANFLTEYDVYPEIINSFPDFDYKFLTFNAGVTFPTNGEMRIDVSDLTDDTANPDLYAYLYRDGALTPIASDYDRSSDELVFRTNYLGAFVISNGEITDLGTDEPDEEPKEEPDDTTSDPSENPATGAAAMGTVIALGIASLTSAGIIRRGGKKSK